MATTQMQGFTRAVAEPDAPETLDFFLKTVEGTDEEGNEIVYRYDEFHASRPTEEQMMFLLAHGMRRDATLADEASAIFDLLQDVLPPQEYRTMEKRFKDPRDTGVGYQVLGELFEWMMEQWNRFPTQPRSGSSTSRARTGGNSKGRVRGPGSTSGSSRSRT